MLGELLWLLDVWNGLVCSSRVGFISQWYLQNLPELRKSLLQSCVVGVAVRVGPDIGYCLAQVAMDRAPNSHYRRASIFQETLQG